MKAYKPILDDICDGIRSRFDGIEPDSNQGLAPSLREVDERKMAAYLLWFADQIQENMHSPLKASRALGWVLAVAEALGLLTDNVDARASVRQVAEDAEEAATRHYASKWINASK